MFNTLTLTAQCSLLTIGLWSLLWSVEGFFYSSYRRIPLCQSAEPFRTPTSNEEMVDIVKEALRKKITVKVFGARHSQTDILCTEGIPVDNHGLRKMVYDPDSMTATFGSGVILHDATEFLKAHGRAFKTTPAFGNITLGGAIGTGAHGSSIKYTSSISSQVVGMLVVDGIGNLRHIDQEEELKAFRVHLGLLGVVLEITLKTYPLYKTRGHNYVVDDRALTDGRVEDWVRKADQISIYWFPNFGELVVANWSIVPTSTEGDAWTYDHVPSTYEEYNIAGSTLAELIFSFTENPCPAISELGYTLLSVVETITESTLYEDTPGFVPIYTSDGRTVENPAVGYYDQMFAPTCRNAPTPDGLTCPWAHGNPAIDLEFLDNEIGFDLKDLPDVAFTVKDIVRKAKTYFPLQGILIRFSASSSTYMSNAYGRDTVHFEWYTWLRNGNRNLPTASLAGYQTIMQVLVDRFGGRAHWGKNGMEYHSKSRIESKLPSVARKGFIAMMDKYDPHGIFMNNFGRRLRGFSAKMDLDPNVTRCALLDNCICTSANDCGVTQECITLPGYEKMPVCRTRGEEPPAPGIKPKAAKLRTLNHLLSNVPGLLALHKADLLKCLAPSVLSQLNLKRLTSPLLSAVGL